MVVKVIRSEQGHNQELFLGGSRNGGWWNPGLYRGSQRIPRPSMQIISRQILVVIAILSVIETSQTSTKMKEDLGHCYQTKNFSVTWKQIGANS